MAEYSGGLGQNKNPAMAYVQLNLHDSLHEM